MKPALITLTTLLTTALLYCMLLLHKRNLQLAKMIKLSEIGKKLTSNIKIKSLIREIMETVKQELKAEACSLYLLDEESSELWFEVALGEKGEQVKEIRLKFGEGIAGWVAQKGASLNLRDVNNDPRVSDIARRIDFEQKAMLTIPVKMKEKVIGVLQVINKIGAPYFTSEDEELLESMSAQIAIALENAKLYKDIHDLLIDSISSLASAVDAKDPYTNGHSKRVTQYALLMGREMGLSEEQLDLLECMALLHDVGKIGIEDSILKKPSALTNEEFVIMKSHTAIGEKILSTMKSLKKIVPGVKYHHEKYDGTGYMDGLKGSAIPLEARIISIADTYDAMTTNRPYRKGLTHKEAISEINKYAGKQFDPEIVKYFNNVMRQEPSADNPN